MALSDGVASVAQVERAQQLARERRAYLERTAAEEMARASEVREHVDGAGTLWRYVLIDDAYVRIESCVARGEELVIPSFIEDRPVVALAPDACARQAGVRSILCSDTLISIGPCAFRENDALERIVFPRAVDEFDSHWVRSCHALVSVKLPGSLERIGPRVFDIPSLKELIIGPGTRKAEPGTFAKSALEAIAVDAENPYLSTDGIALYAQQGRKLVALARPVPSYAVAAGCEQIAKKAFSSFSEVEEVVLPQGLLGIGEFAFSRTGIREFVAPATLREIRDKAFFECERLAQATLNEGLLAIGDNAFSGTALEELEAPASLERMGEAVAARTAVTFGGDERTFHIREGGRHLHADEEGGLYREADEGPCFVRLMDAGAERYEVRPGTVAIAPGAFSGHERLRVVKLPDSLRVIGDGAFRNCRKLEEATLGEGLERIGAEAFLDTALTEVRLPAALTELGENALVTYGAHHKETVPELQAVRVEPGNERFFAEDGLLFERKGTGKLRLVLGVTGTKAVRLDERVDEVAPYALNNVSGIEELDIGDWIASVGIRGLAAEGLIPRIRIGLSGDDAGGGAYELRFPASKRSEAQLAFALSVPERVEPAAFFEHYDTAIVIASGFDAATEDRLDLYEQGTRLVERLRDPVFMTPVNRELAERVLADNIEELCVEAGRHDDRALIDGLFDLGFLNEESLFSVIDRVGSLRDASITGYLLEAKRMRFSDDSLDFEL